MENDEQVVSHLSFCRRRRISHIVIRFAVKINGPLKSHPNRMLMRIKDIQPSEQLKKGLSELGDSFGDFGKIDVLLENLVRQDFVEQVSCHFNELVVQGFERIEGLDNGFARWKISFEYFKIQDLQFHQCAF